MPRPPLVIGTWGKINRVKRGGAWVAYARFRDHDGVTRQLERSGASGQKAEDALKAALRDRLSLSGDDITTESTVGSVGDIWFRDEIEGQKALNTERRYREILDGVIKPGLGGVRLRELSVSRLDRFLKLTTTERGPGTAKQAKAVLSGLVGMAARHGALTVNPLRDVSTIRQAPKEVVVLPLEELWDLREKMYADELAVLQDVVEPTDFMIGTGARIGEAFATRWSDLDLESERPVVRIRATVVWTNGGGMVIQERPKSASSRRELTLPTFLVDTLRERSERQPANDLDLVFPSIRGTIREPAAYRRQWRVLREKIGYDWVHPHTFRKSLATLLDDPKKASEQLGHSGEAITKKNYIPKTHIAPDSREVIDQIGNPALTQRKQLGVTTAITDARGSATA